MPWLVLLFGLMIAPLGITSIFFIIFQPIVIGTWSTLTLVAAAAMLVEIPHSLDELLASAKFLCWRRRQGRSLLRVLLFGDTDEAGASSGAGDKFAARPGRVLKEMWTGGVSLPWNLAAAGVIGAWLMCARLTLGAQGGMAESDHVIGALALTVVSIPAAEVARAARYLLVPLGVAAVAMPFWHGGSAVSMVNGIACGLALVWLALPAGSVRNRYGAWQRFR